MDDGTLLGHVLKAITFYLSVLNVIDIGVVTLDPHNELLLEMEDVNATVNRVVEGT